MVNYHCVYPYWWMHYKTPTLLFIPLPFLLAHYSSVAFRGFAADQTWIWTVSLTEFWFMLRAMFIVTTKIVACSTYLTGNIRFYHVSGGLLFRLLASISETLMYFCFYKFAFNGNRSGVKGISVQAVQGDGLRKDMYHWRLRLLRFYKWEGFDAWGKVGTGRGP